VGSTHFESRLAGSHNISNILAGIAVAGLYGIPPNRSPKKSASFSRENARERFEQQGVMVYNDCYNSNPDAVRAMLDVLMDTPARRRIAVLERCWNSAAGANRSTARSAHMPPNAGSIFWPACTARPVTCWKQPNRRACRPRQLSFSKIRRRGAGVRRLAHPAMPSCSRVPRRAHRTRARSVSGSAKGAELTSNVLLALFEKLFHLYSPFRVFQYSTFRTAMASLTALFLSIALGPWLIARLRHFQIGQHIREDGRSRTRKKPVLRLWRYPDLRLDHCADAGVGQPANPGRVGALAGLVSFGLIGFWTTTRRLRANAIWG